MKQLTIVTDDRVGLLADISYILGRSRINIDSISAGVAGGKAFINLSINDASRATALLKTNKYEVVESDMLVVKLPDTPGELAAVSKKLTDANISIQSVAVLAKGENVVFDGIKVDKIESARKLLKEYIDFEK
ncbi:ACT domain protein [uncultured archaeon]|nr:ACT domain protein [uncultured archaeon]